MITRWAMIITVFLCTLFLTAVLYPVDDAIISYRYVWNLVNGLGLVPYPGGPHLEGYSNPTLVFITALIAYLTGVTSIPSIVRIGLMVGNLAALGCVILLAVLARQKNSEYWHIPSLLLASSIPFMFISGRASGLETTLYAFFILALIWTTKGKNMYLFSWCATLVTLSRPEGFFIAGGCLLGMFYLNYRSKSLWSFLRAVFLGYCVPMSCFLLWRLHYFGQILSNSSIAKLNHPEKIERLASAGEYIRDSILYTPSLLLLVIVSVYAVIRYSLLFEGIVILGQFIFIIGVGGDVPWLGLHRFVVPVIPVMIFSFGIVFNELLSKTKPRIIPILIQVIVIASLALFPHYSAQDRTWKVPMKSDLHAFLHGPYYLKCKLDYLLRPQIWLDEKAGKYLASLVPMAGKGLTLGSGQGGAFPIHWQGEFVDFHGLLSRAFSRNPWNEQVLKENPPDIIALFQQTYLSTEGPVTVQAHFPTARLAQSLGYTPALIIEIAQPPPSKLGFIILKGPGIQLSLSEDLPTREFSYQDETGSITARLPVKFINEF
ncbi:hypothetical protein JXQ70_14000 [bacterium]|nr:hypothetical protein [bacterium]